MSIKEAAEAVVEAMDFCGEVTVSFDSRDGLTVGYWGVLWLPLIMANTAPFCFWWCSPWQKKGICYVLDLFQEKTGSG